MVEAGRRLADLRDPAEEAHTGPGRASRARPRPAGPSPQVRPPLYALVGATALLAYLALWLGGRSPWARYLDHGIAGGSSPGPLLTSALFVLGWTVMVTAMMLPTAVPLFEAFGRIVGRRPDRRRLLVTLAVGFVGVWAAFGYLLRWADVALHVVVDHVEVVADRPHLIVAAVLVAAGTYQFSELKQRCLMRCRSPRSLIVPRWSGGRAGADAFRIGVDYGVYCLGCCWMLMVLLFAVGMGNVGVMLALGLFMTLEKNVPRVRRLTPAVGALLVGAGVAIAVPTVA